jgi:FAD/FMN-containing dehydrogenase
MIRKELSKIVGPENVLDDADTLQKYSQDMSLAPARSPNFVVTPGSVEEIQNVVELGNKYLVPIIPVSSGVHFYGNTIPEQGGITIDLRKLNRICKADERNRAARVEPGVTWGRLQDELAKHNLRALNPFLPHRLKSALSSSLEREPMVIPKTEYGEAVLTMEVVLPNGQVFRTGSAAVGPPGATELDLVAPQGPGLDFFRLFQGAQGTFCIATWVNLKAVPLSKVEKYYFLPFKKAEVGMEVMYAIQRKMIGAESLILNRFNLALIFSGEWPGEYKKLKKTLPPWVLIQCLSGGERFPEEKVGYEEEVLTEISRKLGIEASEDLPGLPDARKSIADVLRKPWEKEPYWKERHKGGFSDIFFYTTLNRVPEFIGTIDTFAKTSGYAKDEIGYYIQPVERGRACYLECHFAYDAGEAHEREKAAEFHGGLSEILFAMGAVFGGPYGSWANLVYGRNAALTGILKELKGVFDPNNVMNPGKLCF